MNNPHNFDTTPPVPVDTAPRMPQYNDANESASQKGQASSEHGRRKVPRPVTTNAAPSTSTIQPASTETDDTLGADPEGAGSVMSARPAPSTMGTKNLNVSTSAAASVISLSLSGFAADGINGSRLTRANMDFHNVLNKADNPCNERLWLLHRGQSPVPSSDILLHHSASAPRTSKRSTADMSDTMVPVSTESDGILEMFGIGGWADDICRGAYN